jgi:ABC-type multidrug transport system fused ATPase/permease subunit
MRLATAEAEPPDTGLEEESGPDSAASGPAAVPLPRVLRGERRRYFALLILNGLVQAAATVGAALMVRRFVDGLGSGAAPGGPGVLPLLLLLLAAATLVGLRVAERRWAEAMAQHYVAALRLRLFDAIACIPVWTLKRRSRGPMMLRFATDLSAVHDWVGRGLARLCVGGILLLGMLGGLFVLDAWFGAAAAGALLLGTGVALAVGPALERRVFEMRRDRGRLAAQVADKLESIALLRLFDREAEERRRLKQRSRTLARSAVARAGVSAFVRVLPDAVYLGALAAVLVLGAWRLPGGATGLGALAGALMLLGLWVLPLRDLARVFDYRQNFKVARRKLGQILAHAEAAVEINPTKRVPLAGSLLFRNVQVDGLLHRFTARVPAKANIAIVGPTGGGKSLLLALAAGLARPDNGRVGMDGIAVDRLPSAVLARNVGMVSTELPLLRGTVRENLVYRDDAATDEDLERVIRVLGLNSLARDLPDGLDTRIADGGIDLPAGIAQRVRLARAMLGEPRLLLLDDPDRDLDAEGSRALDRILAEHRCTALIATADLARARSCDRLWFVEGGRLVVEGPPAELLQGDGPVARYFGLAAAAPKLTAVS